MFFDDYPIFEEVSGKHMIHSYVNSKTDLNYETKLILVDKENFSKDVNKELVTYFSNQDVLEVDSINLDTNSIKIFENCIVLDELFKTSVGVQESSDKVAIKNIPKELENTYFGGEGVFVINSKEVENLCLNEDELKILKPYLNTSSVKKYGIEHDKEYLIFSDKINRKLIEEDSKYINLKKHLDKVSPFITSSNAPYGLHRDRSSKINPFELPKLICPGMFKTPHFTYDDEKYYVGFSFSIIWVKDKNYSLKYLLAIMNSKLGEYWFNVNGKKRGVGVDIGVKVFRQFPIKEAEINIQQPIINIVNEILSLKEKKPKADTTALEKEIDQMVYELYGLTEEEIAIIENCK